MMCPCVKPLWRAQTQGPAQHLWSHRQIDESSPLNILNKSVAASMLQELGEKLQLLAGYETGNMLTCSWRELSEGIEYHN